MTQLVSIRDNGSRVTISYVDGKCVCDNGEVIDLHHSIETIDEAYEALCSMYADGWEMLDLYA